MNWDKPIVYAARHKNEAVQSASRSGGFFTAISDFILDQGGVVYGCVLTENFRAIHIRTNNKIDRDLMRGSKYIQSSLKDTFRNILEDLNSGHKVLFTGTSCQVAGLKLYLHKNYENLLCVDILCHGVPSPKVWDVYKEWMEKKNKSKIISVDFRNKKDFGWHAHVETLYFENGKKVDSKIFREFFLGHYILRPCCYECPYKSIMHPGDITIADYWGIEKAAPMFNDDRGVSLVLINNSFANDIFETIKSNLDWKSTRLENSMQPPLIAPSSRPDNRDEFWHDFLTKDFDYIVNKYTGYGGYHKIIDFIKFKIRRSIGKVKNESRKI